MAVQKRKQSKARGRKRRTHWKLEDNNSISKCPTTGTYHLKHRAYEVDGVLYYKGKILQQNQ